MSGENRGMLRSSPESGAARSGVIRARTSLLAHGEPMVWLTGGALAVCLAMIVGLFVLVVYNGFGTFWPLPLVEITTTGGEVFLGEITRYDEYKPTHENLQTSSDEVRSAVEREGGWARRRLMRTGNFELTGTHFHWISSYSIQSETRPDWAMTLERMTWGRFYGTPAAFKIDDATQATEPAEIWSLYNKHHPAIQKRRAQIEHLEKYEIGEVNNQLERARLAMRSAELNYGKNSSAYARASAAYHEKETWSQAEFERFQKDIQDLRAQNERYVMLMKTSTGQQSPIKLDDIVRAYPANQLTSAGRMSVYVSRWIEFLTAEPREANSEGGVYPAIFGTVVMTLIMAIFVAPFGVLAALYLREYAKAGPMVSGVRIAVNNLAGVPSIVYGVFGLGFFCYMVGGGIDQVFFEARLPNPTYGKGGVLWSSLTLALLTLPVVIVATEEALSAVPNSLREGSYACGASKWQTIQRIILPRALPGIMTGMILAMARGAGEVAPLMLVGAVKLAPELPIDGSFPYLHPERSFMHLGFHIYDLGFQSQNSEAAKPMVFTTTLLLVAIIFTLNVVAVWLRMQLRKRFIGGRF
ncbi:MAG: phosphate ABC transporter permease PstA [bacterium]|nr:phosphate ABC transporter permease PstA [bacterium]